MKIGTVVKGIVSNNDVKEYNSKFKNGDFTEKKCEKTGKLYYQPKCPYCNCN